MLHIISNVFGQDCDYKAHFQQTRSWTEPGKQSYTNGTWSNLSCTRLLFPHLFHHLKKTKIHSKNIRDSTNVGSTSQSFCEKSSFTETELDITVEVYQTSDIRRKILSLKLSLFQCNRKIGWRSLYWKSTNLCLHSQSYCQKSSFTGHIHLTDE